MAKIPLSLPIHDYRVTSGFGPRLDPFKKRAAFHAGVDFGTATGTPVYATLSGTVTRSGYKGPYGLVVEIDHGNGFRSRYGHLARSRVRRGQAVEFQQHIADAGNSGRSTGPHLHYEVWYEGKVRDPLPSSMRASKFSTLPKPFRLRRINNEQPYTLRNQKAQIRPVYSEP